MAKTDILDAICDIRVRFLEVGLSPPAAIVLATHEDGMRFLHSVADTKMLFYSQPGGPAKPVEHPDGSIWMEAEIMGMKIHWPANRYAIQAGGYVYA